MKNCEILSRSLVVIPFRAGSKGLPKKNSKILMGRPMYEWTITSALALFDAERIFVTSDDHSALNELSMKFPGLNCIARPQELATDEAGIVDVVEHVLYEVNDLSDDDPLLLLQVTSPLRTSEDIAQALDLFLANGVGAVVSVSPVRKPSKLEVVIQDGFISSDSLRKIRHCNRQSLKQTFRLNGAIYLTRVLEFRNRRSFFNPPVATLVMNNGVDIDDEIDFVIAEHLMAKVFY